MYATNKNKSNFFYAFELDDAQTMSEEDEEFMCSLCQRRFEGIERTQTPYIPHLYSI